MHHYKQVAAHFIITTLLRFLFVTAVWVVEQFACLYWVLAQLF